MFSLIVLDDHNSGMHELPWFDHLIATSDGNRVACTIEPSHVSQDAENDSVLYGFYDSPPYEKVP